MSFLSFLGCVFGISLGIFIIVLFLIFWGIYRLIKTQPKLSLFILLIFVAMGIAGSFNPITFTPALIMLVGAVGTGALQYKKLKKSLR